MLNVFGPCFKTGRTRPCSLSRLLFDTQRKQIDTSLNQGSRFSHKCENTALFWNKRSHLFPCLKPSMKVGLKPPTRNQILTVRKTNFEKRPPSTTEKGQDSTGRNNSSFAQEFSKPRQWNVLPRNMSGTVKRHRANKKTMVKRTTVGQSPAGNLSNIHTCVILGRDYSSFCSLQQELEPFDVVRIFRANVHLFFDVWWLFTRVLTEACRWATLAHSGHNGATHRGPCSHDHIGRATTACESSPRDWAVSTGSHMQQDMAPPRPGAPSPSRQKPGIKIGLCPSCSDF